jgi:hypothetical protein
LTILEHSHHPFTFVDDVIIETLQDYIFTIEYFPTCDVSQHL